jgi:trk system potassium uptake protein TrkA
VKIVIVGCGRVGATLAAAYDAAGHEVVILDISTRAFDRLDSSFGGSAVRGDGTDEDTLRKAGAEDADVFLALTEGDNRNVMSAQVAVEALGARQVIAKINDPVRAAAYAELGLTTVCRTTMVADAISTHLGLPATGKPSLFPSSGTHSGHAHEQERLERLAAGAGLARPAEPRDATGRPAGAAPSGANSAAEKDRAGVARDAEEA